MSGVVISLDGLLPQEPEPPRPAPAETMTAHLKPALEKFVSAVVRDVLGRDASPSEVSDWVDQIFSGVSRNTVALCLLNSEERRRRVVRHYYQRFLGRTPTEEGLEFWTETLASGRGHEDLIASMVSSEEFMRRHGGSNEAFVQGLFRDLLGRRPNQLETGSWVGLLNGGAATHACVAHSFVTSREFREATVRRWFHEFLKREPDGEGLAYWVEQLANGTPFERAQAGLLSTNEYFSQSLLSDGLPVAPLA